MSVSKTDLEQLSRDLKGPFDLSSDRKREARYFHMETTHIRFGMNGRRLGTESYLLKLQFIPNVLAAENVEQYICSELQFQTNDDPPSLSLNSGTLHTCSIPPYLEWMAAGRFGVFLKINS